LVDFTNAADKFRKMDIGLAAGSVDSLENTRKMADELKISFPLAYGLNAKEISLKTGGFYEGETGYLQPSGFVINPDGKIANAVYATMAIGRLGAQDCIGLISHLRSLQLPTAGSEKR
jgi:peroxiredoxin